MENRKTTYCIPEGMRENVFARAPQIKYRGSAKIHPTVLMDPEVRILGDVTIGEGSSLFYGATIRADNAPIVIGAETNIQEHCILHAAEGGPISVGEHTSIGHGAILHACTIGDNTLVGMNSVVLDGAVVGNNCLIGAGAVVPSNLVVPDGHMVLGVPGRVVKKMTQEQIDIACTENTEINIVEVARMKAEGSMVHPTPELLKKIGCL